MSLLSNSLHFSRDFVRNENSIPWLFTDFDNIKDFPWLFYKFPDLEKIFFSLIFPWPRQPCCYKNTAGESEKRREKHQGIGRYLLLNIQNCSWQLAVNSRQTEINLIIWLRFHTWKRSLNAIPFIPDRTNSVSSVRVALKAPPRKRLQTKILHFSARFT